MMLPAVLAALTLKQVNVAQRLEHVRKARGLFLDFLRRCKDYKISSFHMPTDSESPESTPTEAESDSLVPIPRPQPPDLIAMATQRQAKIER